MIIKTMLFFRIDTVAKELLEPGFTRLATSRSEGFFVLMPIYEYRCNQCNKVFSQLFMNAREVRQAKCRFCGEGPDQVALFIPGAPDGGLSPEGSGYVQTALGGFL